MMEWLDKAACRGANPEMFFALKGNYPDLEGALGYCERCTVKEKCLATALLNPMIEGIWGGTTWDERKLFRRRRQGK